jgi:hypothetical protein
MSRNPGSLAAGPGPLEPELAANVRAQLERVLSSHLFRSSRRCQSLLRHVSERALAGETDGIKERTLGAEVFGRQPDYDTNQDPVVRTTAGEVRKKLAQYYQEPGHETELRIGLPAGSYAPEFQVLEVIPAAPSQATAGRRRGVFAIAAAAVVVIAASLAGAWALAPRSDLDRFWAPILDTQGAILLCLGQPLALNLRDDAAQTRLEEAFASGTPAALPETIPTKDLIVMPDRYVSLGDAACLVRLTAFLERHRRPYRIRGGASTSFSDLREQPTVMVGAFDNEWTLRAVGQLRYTFLKSYSGATETEMVRDRDHPEKTDWKLVNDWPLWNIPSDYAIVSRVRDVTSGSPVIVAAGITHYGTMGAGEFLTDSNAMTEATRSLPSGWEKRNLQIVLRIPVVRGVAGHPRVLATHVW